MDTLPASLAQVSASSKRIAHRLLAVGENRVELLMVELQEERERLVRAILLALGVAAFGLLACMAFTIAVVLILWERSALAALFGMAVIYGVAAAFLYVRLARLQRNWQTFPATLDQLRKDRECLERTLL